MPIRLVFLIFPCACHWQNIVLTLFFLSSITDEYQPWEQCHYLQRRQALKLTIIKVISVFRSFFLPLFLSHCLLICLLIYLITNSVYNLFLHFYCLCILFFGLWIYSFDSISYQKSFVFVFILCCFLFAFFFLLICLFVCLFF